MNNSTKFIVLIKDVLRSIKSLFGNPHQSQSSKDEVITNIDKHLFTFDNDFARRSPNMMNELELVVQLLTYFAEQTHEYTRYLTFELLFTMNREGSKECRREVLCKLVSMAITLGDSVALECAALWMKTSEREHAIHLAERLVKDFCLLKKDGVNDLVASINVSSRFSCMFLTALTSCYHSYFQNEMKSCSDDKSSWPTLKLLEVVQTMMLTDQNVITSTITSMDKLWRTVLKATNKTQKVLPLTPHTYLLAWCIKSPLIPLSILDEKFITNYINISEKLQYFFLMSIQNSKSIMKTISRGSDSNLFKIEHLQFVIDSLLNLLDGSSKFCIDTAVNRLAQILQVSIKMRIVNLSTEAAKDMVSVLPMNSLMNLVTKESTQNSKMDLS